MSNVVLYVMQQQRQKLLQRLKDRREQFELKQARIQSGWWCHRQPRSDGGVQR